MLGENSFRLTGDDELLNAFYLPSFMKKWKNVIGFSGTISEATLT
jgi:hypothetical protein